MNMFEQMISKVLVHCIVIGIVYSQSMDDSKRLLADLTSNYTTEFRPLRNQAGRLNINVGFDLLSIKDFDEVQGTITVTAVLYLHWQDEYFVWEPADYGGLDYIVTSTKNVWMPNILLLNAATNLGTFSENSKLLYVHNTGLVQYSSGDLYSATCAIDVTYYPLDVQTCEFTFVPWGHTPRQIRVLPMNDVVQFRFYVENGAWTVVGSTAESPVSRRSSVSFRLKLERKPLFVALNVILPLTFLSFLNVLIFLLPPEAGERMSYCITMLLAIAVFLTLVADNLPKTSSPVSIYSYYLLSVLVISLCITLCTIFSLHLYHKEESEDIGNCWRHIATCLNCKCTKNRNWRKYKQQIQKKKLGVHLTGSISTTRANHKRTVQTHTNRIGYSNPSFIVGLKQPVHINNNQIPGPTFVGAREIPDTYNACTDTSMDGAEQDIRWKDVSVAVDKIAFVSFILLILIDTVVFFITIYRGRYVELAGGH